MIASYHAPGPLASARLAAVARCRRDRGAFERTSFASVLGQTGSGALFEPRGRGNGAGAARRSRRRRSSSASEAGAQVHPQGPASPRVEGDQSRRLRVPHVPQARRRRVRLGPEAQAGPPADLFTKTRRLRELSVAAASSGTGSTALSWTGRPRQSAGGSAPLSRAGSRRRARCGRRSPPRESKLPSRPEFGHRHPGHTGHGLRQRVKRVYTIGAAAEKIESQIKGVETRCTRRRLKPR